jgi:hypothetical protein
VSAPSPLIVVTIGVLLTLVPRGPAWLLCHFHKPPEIRWDQLNAIKEQVAAERRNDPRTPTA